MSYVEQEPLILSDSVLNNILFGKKYDEALLKKAIKAS